MSRTTPPRLTVEFVGPEGTRGKTIEIEVPRVTKPAADYDDATWDAARSASELSRHLRRGNERGIEATIRAMKRLDCWRPCIAQFLRRPSDPKLGAALRTFWTSYGLCSISPGLKFDTAVVADVLRRHLPPYRGGPVTLYRGQLESLHRAGVHGISWSTQPDAADRLAQFHAIDQGASVVLRIEAMPEQIVAGPTEQSVWIQEYEYIIDPRGIRPEVIKTNPASTPRPPGGVSSRHR